MYAVVMVFISSGWPDLSHTFGKDQFRFATGRLECCLLKGCGQIKQSKWWARWIAPRR
jgi:hypothetical protein